MAGFARSPSQAVPVACSGRARPFRIRCCGCRMRRCSSGRSSSPTPPIASWCWSNWPRSGCEADVLLEPMRRDSGPAIAAGAAFAQTRDSDAVVLALAADHVVARYRGFRRRLPPGSRSSRGGTHRHLRRAARAPGDRIRLYQAGRSHFRRRPRGCEIRREAGSGNGRRLYQGWLSLEQRQLHVPRLRSARRIPQRRRRERARPSPMP